MSVQIARVNFKPVKRLTTQNARKITFPFDVTGCCIVMSFKFKNGFTPKITDVISYEWKTADNTIEFLSGTQVSLREKQILAIAGVYAYDFVITFPNGTIVPYFEGEQTVEQNISTPC